MHAPQIVLHMSLIDGIGDATLNHIIQRKPSSLGWESFALLTSHEWQTTFGLSQMQAQRLVEGLSTTQLLDKELQLIEQHQIQWMTVLDAEYPLLLKNIQYPPAILYWQGESPQSYQAPLAVVGSRQADHYAQRVLKQLLPPLIEQGITTISGGALGADAIAHRLTIQGGAKTMAILGSGLLRWYPIQHRSLFEEIKSTGTLLSVFPLSTAPHAGNFPARNRVIAGISLGCLVVQAAEKSGALITAHYALQEGREVFAIPGMMDDPLSAGCHALIQQGAKLVCQATDIIAEFSAHAVVKDKRIPTPVSAEKITLTESEQVVQLCRQARSIEELIIDLNQDRAQLQALLIDLALAGRIQQDFTGMWLSI